jgi:hypothetical protein
LELGTVATGFSPHSLFVDANGALLVCGFEHGTGTLGLPRDHGDNEDEDFRTVLVPTPVPSLAGVRIRQVVAGYHGSLAVSEAGQVYMWGQGRCGRLASDVQDRLVPTLIQELSHHRVRQVAIDDDLCAAVTEQGLLFTWATAAALADDESERGRPRLGLGLNNITIDTPWPPQCVTALKDERVGLVAVGRDYTLVSTKTGAVFSFGAGTSGSLGHGSRAHQILPKRMEALRDVHVATVAAGGYQSLALTACGRVFWCGVRMKYNRDRVPVSTTTGRFGFRWRACAEHRGKLYYIICTTSYAVTDAGVLFI